ncbi:hypothetical protein [Microcoleus phage My-WqHQDG]|nr:hypothetical protein [Microcoleus phage My-WqHQDG]
MNLLKSIKCLVIEAYTVVCLSIKIVQATEKAEEAEEAVVSEASDTVTDNVAAAVVVKSALAEADAAAKCCDTLEGYQEYCAAVQRLFAAEDAMLEAAGLSIQVAAAATVEVAAGALVSTAQPTPEVEAPTPTEVVASAVTPVETSTAAEVCVHSPAGALVPVPTTLSPEATAMLSEWDNNVWLASKIGQEVEAMAEEIIRHELFCDEYFGNMRARRSERMLNYAVAKAEAKEAKRPTSFSWSEWNELTLAEKAVSPLPAKVCSAVGTTVYTTALVAGGAAVYSLAIIPMSAGMGLVAFLGTIMLAPTGVIVAAMRIAELNGIEVIEFTNSSCLDD